MKPGAYVQIVQNSQVFQGRQIMAQYKSQYWTSSSIFNLMDELGFYVPSAVFQSFRDDGRVNMKGSVQWSAI